MEHIQKTWMVEMTDGEKNIKDYERYLKIKDKIKDREDRTFLINFLLNKGFEEGRKEKWHDLRKDPNDLPKKNGKYIIYIKVSEKRTITDTCDFFNGYFGQYIKPIAWCELPKFKE